MNDVIDIYSIGHVLFFFILGIFVLLSSKKLRNGIIACIILAIVWEILENDVIGVYITWFGDPSLSNSIIDILIPDTIGIILAYLLVRRIKKGDKI